MLGPLHKVWLLGWDAHRQHVTLPFFLAPPHTHTCIHAHMTIFMFSFSCLLPSLLSLSNVLPGAFSIKAPSQLSSYENVHGTHCGGVVILFSSLQKTR